MTDRGAGFRRKPFDLRGTLLAGSAGSVLEWYDFAIYGFLATTIGKSFFPSGDSLVSLLSTFAVFAVGFLARPLGGVLFGYIGDRLGRRPALILSIACMAASTTLIALLPTYAMMGVAAPLLLLVLRITQGLSAGGEYSSASVYVAEHAPTIRRGFLTSFIAGASVSGVLLGSAVGAATAAVLGEAMMQAWGWRVPFAVGGLLSIILMALRRNMPESPIAAIGRAARVSPMLVLFREHWRKLLHITALTSFGATAFFLYVYAISYNETQLKFSTVVSLDMYMLSLAIIIVVALVVGYLSDAVGRRAFFMLAGVAGIVASWPLFWLMHHHSVVLVALGHAGFAVLVGIVFGVLPATLAEILPATVRCSGAAIGYSLCLGVLGGTTPLIATSLVAASGDPLAPAWYLIAMACLTLTGGLRLQERAGLALARA